MVDADASLPLPWLDEPLGRALRQGAHALLVHGPEGIGQFELGLTLAKAWLCEGTAEQRSHGAGCGVCRSCHLIEARSHPDLLVLIPELLRESLGWAGESEEGGWEKGSKSKPSKEIKVEAVRRYGPGTEAELVALGNRGQFEEEQRAYDRYNWKGVLKKKLQNVITVAATVDFAAQTTDTAGRKKFVNPAYEKKNSLWKAMFRAGKAPTLAAAEFAKSWMKEL